MLCNLYMHVYLCILCQCKNMVMKCVCWSIFGQSGSSGFWFYQPPQKFIAPAMRGISSAIPPWRHFCGYLWCMYVYLLALNTCCEYDCFCVHKPMFIRMLAGLRYVYTCVGYLVVQTKYILFWFISWWLQL